ncbi:MAG: CRISPR-associated endonuclease Cas1, partial [Thermoprotei archaeon]
MIFIVKGIAKISKRGSTIVVSIPKRDSQRNIVWESQSIPLLDLELLIIVGSRVRLSSGVALMLSEANVPVIIHSRRSDCLLMNPFNVRIAEARRKLYNIVENPSWRVSIGRNFIEGKLSGLANLVRYLAYKDIEKGIDAKWILKEIASIEELRKNEINNIRNVDGLRLYEAKWSKKLWELLVTFVPNEYEFTGRDPKSKDPINSAISYAYAI